MHISSTDALWCCGNFPLSIKIETLIAENPRESTPIINIKSRDLGSPWNDGLYLRIKYLGFEFMAPHMTSLPLIQLTLNLLRTLAAEIRESGFLGWKLVEIILRGDLTLQGP
jgi:hypothetical protein